MTDNATVVLRQALALPADERAHIAADLIASLDEQSDDAEAVTSAWAAELEHRARQMLRDPLASKDWDSIRERVVGRLTNE